ncbi:hypothetical protein L2E82_07158 [Cichorium intybus]|uniref:Uncharacterized protein n=1 Tax=Cichorium intybus TaxID=13427 RepID=A0ACB9G3F7_CICIN|nr:hypothetical protein L2E82_07158 [Cichorium intybus]
MKSNGTRDTCFGLLCVPPTFRINLFFILCKIQSRLFRRPPILSDLSTPPVLTRVDLISFHFIGTKYRNGGVVFKENLSPLILLLL